VTEKSKIFLEKTEKDFLPEVVLNQFDKFFRNIISYVFFKYTSKKNLRKTGSISSLMNRKLSRILLTNFSDVFFETGSCLEHFLRIFQMFSLKPEVV